MLSIAIKTFILMMLVIWIVHFTLRNVVNGESFAHAPPPSSTPPPAILGGFVPAAVPATESDDLDEYFESIKAAPPQPPMSAAPAPGPQSAGVLTPMGFDGMYGTAFSML